MQEISKVLVDNIEYRIKDSVARDEKLPTPKTASVGKYIKVAAVDENGKVSEVVAVDAPSGGGGGSGEDGFSPIANVVSTENGAIITITDKEGTTSAYVANGKDGYTPVKGVDYSDGYTPVKGVDYFDGKDGYTPVKGKDYFDGTSATHEWDGTVLKITSASGTTSADLKGEPGHTPIKGIDYFDGESVRHTWYGTTLNIISASGSSSADLKGEPGEPGYTPVKGKDYFDGEPGYTPVKGRDYSDGEDGGYYVPHIYQNDDKVYFEFLPSSNNMPTVDPKEVDLPQGAGGAEVYIQPEEPSNMKVGSLWYDTDEDEPEAIYVTREEVAEMIAQALANFAKQYIRSVNGLTPDENGNVNIVVTI
jgi:hypothetical protein